MRKPFSVIALITLAACSKLTTPVSPTAVVGSDTHLRPFQATDVDWKRRIIGNPSGEPLTVTVGWSDESCSAWFGSQTVTVGPNTIGTFEPPRLACGQKLRAQGDGYFGTQLGECRNPDFSSGQTANPYIEFAGEPEPCSPPPPPPPPLPPPPCEDPIKDQRVTTHPDNPRHPICPVEG